MNDSTSRLNRLLTILFATLLGMQVLYQLVGFASMPAYYQRVTTQTIEPVIYYGKVQLSNALTVQLAFERGMSLAQYAAYRNIVNASAALIPIGVAALIIWRARGQWFAWFTAFIIVFLGESALAEQMLVSQYLSVEVFGANAFFWFLVLPYFFLFPNGRAVPRRAAWLVGALVVYHLLVQTGTVIAYSLPDLALSLNLPNWGQSSYIWPVLINFVVILACQTYRYRRVSTATERQQTKWFLFGFGLIVALIPVSVLVDVAGQGGFLNDFTDVTLWIPLYGSLAIAITRYRLFDIDLIIRKTLVYSILTGLLALIYFGGVVLVQQLTRSITASSDLAIAVSTLAIAALFLPLRRRVQNTIDRRFYRRKYDAAKTLAAFGVTVRDEVELDKLTSELLNVVSDTMQPASVSLWLKKTADQKTRMTG